MFFSKITNSKIPVLLLINKIDIGNENLLAEALKLWQEKVHKTNRQIPMRDGKKLFTVVYSPKDNSKQYPILMNRTRFGLRLRAVGENPAAVDTAGISVVGLRFAAVAITGVLCGLAGAYMATALQAGFGREMTAGRGYIALAALIFAKWKPFNALGATMFFGFLQAMALRPDVVERLMHVSVPVPFLDALPYLLTVVVLAGMMGRAIAPRAGGEPYVKER